MTARQAQLNAHERPKVDAERILSPGSGHRPPPYWRGLLWKALRACGSAHRFRRSRVGRTTSTSSRRASCALSPCCSPPISRQSPSCTRDRDLTNRVLLLRRTNAGALVDRRWRQKSSRVPQTGNRSMIGSVDKDEARAITAEQPSKLRAPPYDEFRLGLLDRQETTLLWRSGRRTSSTPSWTVWPTISWWSLIGE